MSKKSGQPALEGERQFQSLFNGAPDGMLVLDDRGHALEANPAACALLGVSLEQIKGRSIGDFIDPATSFSQSWITLHNQGQARGEWRLLPADGVLRQVDFTATAGFFPGRHLFVLRDITERKWVEEDLHKYRQVLQSFLDNSPAVIYAKDWHGRYLFVNRCFEKLFHVSNERVKNKTDFDIWPRESAEKFRANDRAVLESGRVIESEEIAPHDDGPHHYISIKFPLYDAAGAVYGVCGISTDITERKAAEEQLRRSERMLLEAQRVGQIGSWEWQVETNSVTWSDEMYRIYGLEPQQFLATYQAYLERVCDEDRESVRALVEKALADHQPFENECRVLRPDGSVRVLHSRGEVIEDAHGNPTRMIGICQDISEQRQLEQQLRQSQKMEAVGRLAGGIAHDFNNLLTAIMGYSDMLLGRFAAQDPQRRNLEEIHKAAQRGASLTQQLLAFSRKQVLVPEVLDLGVVVRDLSKMLWRLIGEDIALGTVVHPHTERVKADRGQIAQVIINLAVNARDAMPQGGKLVLEVRNAEAGDMDEKDVAAFDPSRFVLLAVSDTGTGITAENRRHLFEPFFTTKGAGQGTGLGLATVHGIVEQSGGHIRVTSVPAQGTTFRILLPRAEAWETEPERTPERSPLRRGHETILLVEDESNVRELTRDVLESHGFKVLEAVSGEEALKLTQEHAGAIDLLLTDVVMPGMSGRVLAERLTGQRAGLKVLYMSGYTDDAILRRGVRTRGAEFIQKPFSPLHLVQRIREVLDGPAQPASARARSF